MGVGNLTRRVGMNKATREDRQTLGAAMGDKPAEPAEMVEKAERTTSAKVVTDVTEAINALVREFANAESTLAAAKEYRDSLKERALALSQEHGIDDFIGEEGAKVQVIKKKAPTTFDKKKAKGFMTEAQFQACQKTGKVPAPTVKFVPPKK